MTSTCDFVLKQHIVVNIKQISIISVFLCVKKIFNLTELISYILQEKKRTKECTKR